MLKEEMPGPPQSQSQSQSSQEALTSGYRAPADRYDEMFAAPGVPRPHWQALYTSLNATSPRELNARISAAERHMRDSGVTYNVYDDPEGLDRQWEMDMLPMLISMARKPCSRTGSCLHHSCLATAAFSATHTA